MPRSATNVKKKEQKGKGRKRRESSKTFFKRKLKKSCEFCIDKSLKADYKDLSLLRKYLTERGKIKPRRSSGCCAKHQRKITDVIKIARELVLVPYAND